MGAYTSMVSRALSRRFCSGQASPVRMLCSRSQSLMIITRTSRLMASSILRRFSACSSSMLENWILVSLVTPSTSRATSSPKAAFRSSSVVGVSSTTSCSRAAAMLSVVHAKVQHQPGHSQRMADIGLAAAAADALVGSVGKVICLFDHLHIVGAAAGLDGLTQLFPGNDLRPHLRRQRAFRGIGQLCCCRNGSRFLHRRWRWHRSRLRRWRTWNP